MERMVQLDHVDPLAVQATLDQPELTDSKEERETLVVQATKDCQDSQETAEDPAQWDPLRQAAQDHWDQLDDQVLQATVVRTVDQV